jgi:hypothetical protein
MVQLHIWTLTFPNMRHHANDLHLNWHLFPCNSKMEGEVMGSNIVITIFYAMEEDL